MDPVLDKKLVETFPNLYRDRGGNPMETGMCWGLSCGDGWFALLWRLSEKLEPLCEGTAARAVQIKEKFGTLRFYMSDVTDEMHKLIAEAEAESETTCELCGSSDAKARGGGWVKTLCEACEAKKVNA